MHKTIWLFALIILCGFSVSPPNISNDKVIKIAQENLSVFLEKIPVGLENYYGFADREEFKKCSVGKPYRVITFNNDFYNEENLSDKNYILVSKEWRVPITVNGENRILFTVMQHDTTMEVVDLGGAALAKELQQKDPDLSSNVHYLLRIYPLTIDFLAKASTDDSFENASYIPLTSAVITLDSLNNKSVLTLPEILHIVKQKLKETSIH